MVSSEGHKQGLGYRLRLVGRTTQKGRLLEVSLVGILVLAFKVSSRIRVYHLFFCTTSSSKVY